MIFSNVPGPRELQFIEGNAVQMILGFVPLVGNQQAGFACFSYAGDVTLSMICNPDNVKHPEKFCKMFLAELLDFKREADAVEQNDKDLVGVGKGRRGRRGTMVDKVTFGQGVSDGHQVVVEKRRFSVFEYMRRGNSGSKGK